MVAFFSRLVLEISRDLTLRMTVTDRHGVTREVEEAEAWRRYYRMESRQQHTGTLRQIRNAYVLQLIDEGLTQMDAAERLGVSPRTLGGYLAELGLTEQHPDYDDSRKGEAIALSEKVGYREAGRTLDIPHTTIRRWAKRAGVNGHAGGLANGATNGRSVTP